MADLDRWLAAIANDDDERTARATTAVLARIAAEPAPAAFAVLRERRRLLVGLVAAAIFGFCATAVVEASRSEAPLWVAAAPSASLGALFAGLHE